MLQRVQIVLLFLFIGVYSISQVDRKTEKETNLLCYLEEHIVVFKRLIFLV